MNDVAKYKLELKSKDETYTRCRIGGLDMAYYKCEWNNNKLETFGGICGLNAGIIENAIFYGKKRTGGTRFWVFRVPPVILLSLFRLDCLCSGWIMPPARGSNGMCRP